jgi:hypothetical protein
LDTVLGAQFKQVVVVESGRGGAGVADDDGVKATPRVLGPQ